MSDWATCGTCGFTWDDSVITGRTPVPSGRTPCEYWHDYDDESEFVGIDRASFVADRAFVESVAGRLTRCINHPGRPARGFDREHLGYCEDCANEREREAMRASAPGDGFLAYVSPDWREITTWLGASLGRIVWVGGAHNRTAHLPRDERRYYLRAVDSEGRLWAGTGAPGMWASLRLCKRQR